MLRKLYFKSNKLLNNNRANINSTDKFICYIYVTGFFKTKMTRPSAPVLEHHGDVTVTS